MEYFEFNEQNQKNSESKPIKKDPLETLKERMRSNENVSEKVVENESTAEKQVEKEPTPEKKKISLDSTQQISLKPKSAETETKETNPLVMFNAVKEEKTEIKEETPEKVNHTVQKVEEDENDSLLSKMKRYTVDENGNDAAENNEPAYKLQTVTEILKSGNDDAITNISKMFDSNFQTETEEPIEESEHAAENNEPEQKIGYISDIDDEPDSVAAKTATAENTATIRFTPVKSGSVSVSSMTKNIELGEDIPQRIEKNIYSTEEVSEEFSDFNPEEEITDKESAKKILVRLARKKRNSFLRMIATVILFVVLAVFSFLKSPNMLVSTVIFGIIFILNIDSFTSFTKLFSKHCTGDSLAAISALCTLALAIFSYLEKQPVVFPVVLTGGLLLTVRSFTSYFKASSIFGNLRVITVGKRKRNAVCLIGDNATTVAMAKNCIEGDVLIASAKQVENISDYMKYSKYSNILSGKMTFITLIFLAIAAVFGVSSAVLKHSVITGFYSASAVLSFAAVSVLFLIDSLPLRSASKKLNRIGAMITGTAAAQKLELANAAVVSTADIFPAGSITLENMKVLCNNDVDDILLRAASLTEALNSPLSPIFKKIVGTSEDYTVPDSDTVKYEERLGISGWVNNELMFIGNRTLLESHGIPVPNVDIDHKILAEGYFPIYVAKENKACVLIIAKYKVNKTVAQKLNKIIELGVTLLVENSDPNITKDMICDYFDLYDDSVMVMTSAGVKMHKSATSPCESASAPAAFRDNSFCIVDIINAASRIKKSNLLLSVLYVLAAVLGTIYFIYTSFTGGGVNITGGKLILIYQIVALLVSIIVYLFKKP